MSKEIHTQLIEALEPAMLSFGFLQSTTFRRNGVVTRVHFMGPDDLGFDSLRPTVDIYAEDMYPNEKGEAFMHCFNCIGSSTKAKDLVDHLNRCGIKARPTTHRKFKGIRFAFNYDWS
jgi:hypothetical protein